MEKISKGVVDKEVRISVSVPEKWSDTGLMVDRSALEALFHPITIKDVSYAEPTLQRGRSGPRKTEPSASGNGGSEGDDPGSQNKASISGDNSGEGSTT